MRVLYVYESIARWGGIERVLADKVNAFVQTYGYEVYILTTDQGSHPIPFSLGEKSIYRDLNIRFCQQYTYRGIKRYWLRWRLSRLFKKRLSAQLSEIKPDVILADVGYLVKHINAVRGDIPLILESHSGFDHAIVFEKMNVFHRWRQLQAIYQASKSTVVVALTEGDAKSWSKVCRAVTIPNIVHLNATGKYSGCENKRVIFVGRFAKQKGIPDLLAVWRVIHEKYPEWSLDMYGEGELKEVLKKEIECMHANIYMREPVGNIHDHYIDSSVFVLTSIHESFGLVMPEAMSCGLPVVAFDCPHGPASIITDGEDGFLIKDRSIENFAQRLCQLIEDRALRLRMGRKGIVSSQRFKPERIIPMWKELFESLTKK